MSAHPPRSESHPLLIGVSAGALLFALTLCTVMMFFFPTFNTEWASATQPGSSWTPPPPTPTPSPLSAAIPTPSSPPSTPTTTIIKTPPSNSPSFKTGDVVTNINDGPVNMRRSPGYLGKPNSDRIGLVPSGAQLRIVDGPESKDDLVWWQVQWKNRTGWMAERTAGGVLILQLAQ